MSPDPLWSTNVRRGVRVPTRDGSHLSVDLYLPEGEGPWPLVLEYQPYRKDEVGPGERFYTYLPEHGYIVARLDVRGTGASSGTSTDEYVPQEQDDGYDAIEWLAAQSFCDGNVNMMGISYGGFTALQIAATQPPHLRSIIPMYFTDDRYLDDCHYVGGQPRLYYDIGFYGTLMVAYNAMPPDPEWCEDWAEIWQQHLDGNQPYQLNWLRNQVDGPYWRHGSVGDIVERIQCPVFLIGGWADGYRNTNLRLFEKLTVPKRVLIGPWNHEVPDAAVPGPRIDHLHEVVRWLDHWCGREGGDPGIEPAPVVLYEQHFEPPVDADRVHQPGRWRAERSWPADGSGEVTYHLGKAGVLGTESSAGGEDALVYDPTVGTSGGLWSGGLSFGLPSDQRLDEARSATYTTAPLTEDLHVLGRATARLHVSTSATVLGFFVSLCDVAPDGSSQLVAKGTLNATRRNSMTDPEPLTPGEQYELEIEIDCASWRFQAGHRIRIAIANADWPNVWPTPEPASSVIHWGQGTPSRLTLPTVPAESGIAPPMFQPAPDEPVPHRLEAEPAVWRVERDPLNGQSSMRYQYGYVERVSDQTVVDHTYEFETHVDPQVPSATSARGKHISTMVRRDGTITSTATVSVRGTATHFHFTAGVAVTVDGTPHFARSWTESVPRHLC